MALLKNVDIAARIEYFQNRLQALSMAFHVSLQEAFVAIHCCPNGRCTLVYQIAAYGDIRAQLGKLLEAQHLSPSNGQDQRLSTNSLMAETTTTQITQIMNYEPQLIKVSYSESCKLEARRGRPTLISRYDMVRIQR